MVNYFAPRPISTRSWLGFGLRKEADNNVETMGARIGRDRGRSRTSATMEGNKKEVTEPQGEKQGMDTVTQEQKKGTIRSHLRKQCQGDPT
jgi:hypothetical protein